MSDAEQKKVFAKNLNNQLSLTNKTQKEVADAIGVSPQTFNTWCQAIALPRMGKIQLLADYFGIGKSDLIDETSTESPSTTDSLTVTGLEKDIIIEYRMSDDIAQAIVLRALDLDDGSRKEEPPRAAEPETPPAPVRKGFNSLMDEINEPMLNAAHALDGATPEDIQHDNDIMNDDSEW